ncbi:mechanosensitive ion channel family protein [Parahaliea maris]|uniref:Mechanosensitive ion channel family protein n=1 Tax=Parahaliea maris TaxID=2716870 RepID=A0A5C8ZXY6_9GAMM|nr:mechanosensitive ion channel family protein [Parahaliea maris]TXS92709.1 mechanosensitive ion channel family protein [Parahaliea maris]
MSEVSIGTLEIPTWLLLTGAVLALAIVFLAIKRFILVRLTRLTDRSQYRYDSLLLRAANFPLTIAILVACLFLLESLLRHYGVMQSPINGNSVVAAKILLIFAILIFVDRFAIGALQLHAADGSQTLQSSRGILKGITRGVIFGIGLLMIMGTLGISITPIVASLGITSLAVALALQPTLENFFSGVQLVIDKPIRVDDFIELDSGEQGFVEKIGWRSTWIRMLPNNTVIMPNSALSNSKIINYFYPSKELSVPVEVGVHYSSDLDHVERVTLEVAREILKTHEWGVGDYDTFVLFHTFDSSSINLTVMLRAQEYYQRFWVKSAFVKALHKRYAEEGIVIPYPIRAINTDQEGAKLMPAPGPGAEQGG